MSQPLTALLSFLLGPLKTVSLEPSLSGPLLWGLTSAPPEIRDRLTKVVFKVVGAEKLPRVIKTLKWLFILGLVRKANGFLNRWALNNWTWSHDRGKWLWNREVAVVTGGCGGIGSFIVKDLVRRGVTVAVVDVTQQLPTDMQNNSKIKFFECDISSEEQVLKTADAIRASLGAPSILVNNAGIAVAHTIMETTPDYLNKLFGVNVFSNFYLVKAFLPDMLAQNKGQIVTIASTASYVTAPGLVDYCASKAAINSFHEGLNMELKHRYKAPYIITTSVHPTYVSTPLVKTFSNSLKASKTPILKPEQVANSVVKQIFSLQGGQLILPAANSGASALRGWPNWLHALVLDGTATHVHANRGMI